MENGADLLRREAESQVMNYKTRLLEIPKRFARADGGHLSVSPHPPGTKRKRPRFRERCLESRPFGKQRLFQASLPLNPMRKTWLT